MLIYDGDGLKRLVARKKNEDQLQQAIDYDAHRLRDAAQLKDWELSPANAARQRGKTMWPHELEKLLKRLIPDCHFRMNSTGQRGVYDKDDKLVATYPGGPMPEWSIMATHSEEVRDFSVRHISAKDMPKHEGELRPGWKVETIPYGEAERGWRTVLLIGLVKGYYSKERLEQLVTFDGSRASWAAATGRSAVSPW